MVYNPTSIISFDPHQGSGRLIRHYCYYHPQMSDELEAQRGNDLPRVTQLISDEMGKQEPLVQTCPHFRAFYHGLVAGAQYLPPPD